MAPYNQLRNVITSAFSSFGYTPTEAEIQQLIPIVNTESGGAERGTAAVANYVQTVRNQQERKKNDPLNQVIADERGFFTDTEKRASDLKSNLDQGVKLFGSLNPDQIDQYLKPLSRSADESNSRLQGDAARRGITGSSTEFQTLADNERKYREDVLSQALQIGMAERDRTSQMLQQQYGFLPGSLQRQGAIAGQQSTQQASETDYLNQLPIYLRGISAQEAAVNDAIQARKDAASQAKKNGLFSTAGSIAGGGVGFLAGGPMGAVIGSQIGSQVGSSAAGGPSGTGTNGLDLSSMLLLANKQTAKSNFIGGNTYKAPASDDYGSYSA